MPLPELPELEELYRLYRADLYRYLCHLTHDPAEAEDLLSETFLRALNARARRVVQLRAMGYSYNEIAAELHISESSARVIEHRTRTWLKQMLAKEGYDL